MVKIDILIGVNLPGLARQSLPKGKTLIAQEHRLCRLLVPSGMNTEVEFVNVTTVKWIIMLLY